MITPTTTSDASCLSFICDVQIYFDILDKTVKCIEIK